jgi:hypothetical protein
MQQLLHEEALDFRDEIQRESLIFFQLNLSCKLRFILRVVDLKLHETQLNEF